MSIERGFNRIVIFLSIILSSIVLVSFIWGVTVYIQKANILNKVKNDPQFISFSIDEQNIILNKISDKYDMSGFSISLFFLVMTVLMLVLFLSIKWIVKGFVGKSNDNKIEIFQDK